MFCQLTAATFMQFEVQIRFLYISIVNKPWTLLFAVVFYVKICGVDSVTNIFNIGAANHWGEANFAGLFHQFHNLFNIF